METMLNYTVEIVEPPTRGIIAGRRALKRGEPWIVPQAIEYLKKLVRPNWHVFEWGAGGSTIWFARNCANVTTIEGSKKWYNWVKNRLEKEELTEKATVILKLAGKKRFTDYVSIANEYPDRGYSLVSVDGIRQSRPACVRQAIHLLKPGGILLLDNPNHYKLPVGVMPGWKGIWYETKPFKWLRGKTEIWATLILFKPV